MIDAAFGIGLFSAGDESLGDDLRKDRNLVRPPPSAVRLFGDLELPAHLPRDLPSRQFDLRLPRFVGDRSAAKRLFGITCPFAGAAERPHPCLSTWTRFRVPGHPAMHTRLTATDVIGVPAPLHLNTPADAETAARRPHDLSC